MDFGAPNYSFLTHLHNGHTAPESDGNPHYAYHRFSPLDRYTHEAAFEPGEWVDNMYLGYPAGGDEREKQSFFWFHDHVHGHTGANVYKGMVGLMPLYDPVIDNGDETTSRPAAARASHRLRRRHLRRRLRHPAGALRLPARRRRHAAQGRAQRQRRDAPGVVGQDVLPSLPQPRLRGRHLHRERDGVPGAGGQAAQVPPALPRRLDLAHLRVQAHALGRGPEGGPRPRLHRRRAAGPVPAARRPAVHEARADRQRRRPAAQADRARLVRAVAGQAARVRRRLHEVSWTARRPRRATRSTWSTHEDDDRPHVGHPRTRPTRSRS